MTPASPRTRRQVLSLLGGGAAGAVLASLPGCGGSDGTPTATPPGGAGSPTGAVSDPAWAQPPLIQSRGGTLDVTLRIEPRLVPYGAGERWSLTVNGTTPGPTLSLRPGDRLRIRLENRIGASTNLHTHGLHVSPEGKSDNPFVEIASGESFDYEIDLPADHPGGLFWYHPHFHHHVAEQLFAGFYGAIVVQDDVDRIAEIAAASDRLILLHDTRQGSTRDAVMSSTAMQMREGREGELVLVNGAEHPTLDVARGTLERWRILNASPSRFYRLKLDGHQFHVMATDAGRLAAPLTLDELVMVPGERVEALVRPSTAGSYRLQSLPVTRGSMGMGGGSAGASASLDLATVRVAGGTGADVTLPARVATLENLEGSVLARTRQLEFQMLGPSGFLIDGKPFDAARVDQSVALGTTEDWVIRNTSPMDHPFHLHVWPFQVMERSVGAPPPGWKDVVNVPAGGWVRIRIPFRDIPGKAV